MEEEIMGGQCGKCGKYIPTIYSKDDEERNPGHYCYCGLSRRIPNAKKRCEMCGRLINQKTGKPQ